ncbi:carboxypeptidase regulatory-like domain-containing protein [Geoalkalibacter halelectricus]|uniref:Carboxypeptidase regulatory-like domain-containing protein n=1 Tax=Geoalkalibacter halelectricus TaxID=2847045 RepID=A0ABY5ZSW1_9BACT|nr:carboxypeptidase regulatory-like domain-containing protein [Geoalkalibacter halelectricus]MDO3377490.1 carboxypeptidase regulatory-like domain-containing protein [Geoalkalibacter halelectricus]UWZ80749.1 carboxypeptidase regulatory-like domain-containing protein [Geoalkalibacter halelectricus]
MNAYFRPALAALFLVILAVSPTWAHSVSIFAYVDNQRIYTESYFSTGQPVREGRVLVFDGARDRLLEGKTDAEGLFDFAIPKIDDLSIVIEAGLGHKAVFVLDKSDLQE